MGTPEDDRRDYAKRFGMSNILTNEEKSSLEAFARRMKDIDDQSLFKLNNGQADELATEEKDLVAWEIKIRELEILKRRNIDPSEDFSIDRLHKEYEYDPSQPNLENLKLLERNQTMQMTDELLEESRRIIESTPIEVGRSDLRRVGGGVNYLWNKYAVVDDNGNKVTINNRELQEHYRKMYIKRMSEVTGRDYTQYDLTESDGTEFDFDYDKPSIQDNSQNNTKHNININDYEDD